MVLPTNVNFYSSSWPTLSTPWFLPLWAKKCAMPPTPDPHSFSCSYYTKTNYVISYNNTENQATHHIQLYTHVHTIQLFYLLSSKASSKEISSTWILNCADLLLITNRREKTEKQFKSSNDFFNSFLPNLGYSSWVSLRLTILHVFVPRAVQAENSRVSNAINQGMQQHVCGQMKR